MQAYIYSILTVKCMKHDLRQSDVFLECEMKRPHQKYKTMNHLIHQSIKTYIFGLYYVVLNKFSLDMQLIIKTATIG